MPQLIRNIDEIAREKQRDVVFVQFHNFSTGFVSDYRKSTSRNEIMRWLEDNEISFCQCGGFDSGGIIDGYCGELYIDVPIDHENEDFIKLAEWFFNEPGHRRVSDAWLFYLPLAVALLNTDDEEDEDGVWYGNAAL